MAVFFRKLTFLSYDLGEDVALVLTFNDDSIQGLYKTVFPTAFMVTEFGKIGGYAFDAVYKEKFGFVRAQDAYTLRPATAYSHPIKAGQETSLTKDGSLYRFSEPKDVVPINKQIVVRNDTSGQEDIGFGFFLDPNHPPYTILVFDNLGAGAFAHIQFTPILRGYIVTGHQEGQVIRGPISGVALFSQDLTKLAEETTWKVTYNPGTGKFEITREI